MPLYKKPEERASETVTVRLTLKERHMLVHLAELEGKTLTDFLRGLIADRAAALNVVEAPEPARMKRPGRPKRHTSVPPEPPPPLPQEPAPSQVPTIAGYATAHMPSSAKPGTFHELVERFRETFAHRADGTRRELEDTLNFLMSGLDGAPIIALETPLGALTGERLKAIREAVQTTSLRLAKKNLHLTYLRMMLHFGVKEPDIDLHVNPAHALTPLTIVEAPDNWRFFGGQT